MRCRTLALLGLLAVSGCDSNPNQTCTYTLSPTSYSVGPQGGTSSVAVTTGGRCDWTARSENSWITVTGGASGTGSGTVAFAVAATTDTTSRSGSLTIAGLSFAVSQQGQAPCSYAVSPTSRSFGAAGGTGALEVTAPGHCSWTAATSAEWLAIVTGGQGSGDGTVTYAVAPNVGSASRTASVTVGSSVHSVVQAGISSCPVTISPDDETFGTGGGSGSFAVTAASGCVWLARSSASWIRVTAPPDGLGDGSGRVSYTVDANTAADARTGTMTVGDQTFVVTQAGTRTCEYSVSPVTFNECMLVSGQRTVTVATQTACSWTAGTSASWITIVSGQSGLGSGTAAFSVASNYYGAARDGIIQIRWPTPTQGQNVTVRQAGCLYAFNPQTFTVAAAGGDFYFEVISGPTDPMCGGPLQDQCYWTVESSAPWLTVLTSMPRNGDSRVYFRVASNLTGTARSATLKLGTQTVLVTQSGT